MPVRVPLPTDLIADLTKLTLVGGFDFVVESELPSSVAEYYRVKLGKAATKAKVKGAHPHRFRDTFAVRLLEKGRCAGDSVDFIGSHLPENDAEIVLAMGCEPSGKS